MTMTRDRLAQLKQHAQSTFAGYRMLVDAQEMESLLALAERALEPQGQALPELSDTRLWSDLLAYLEGGLESPGPLEADGSIDARALIARMDASQLALPAGPVPEGFVLVPMHLNAEMRDVLSEEDWTWEDLLVAANAVTEEQYYAIQSGDGESPAVAQPVADEREAFEAAWIDIGGLRMEDYDLSQAANGNYSDGEVQAAWEIWQARAALCQPAEEKKPHEWSTLRRGYFDVFNDDGTVYATVFNSLEALSYLENGWRVEEQKPGQPAEEGDKA